MPAEDTPVRWRVQFSLLSLLLFVLLIGCGTSLWWRWGPWELEQELGLTSSGARVACVTGSGSMIAIGLKDGTTRLYDSHGRLLSSLGDQQSSDLMWTCFVGSSEFVTVADHEGNVMAIRWEMETGSRRVFINIVSPALFLGASDDGSLIIFGDKTGKAYVYGLDGSILAVVDPGMDELTSVCFSKDLRYAAFGDCNGSVVLWDWQNRKQLWRSKPHVAIVKCIVFMPESKCLLTGGWDSCVCRLDLSDATTSIAFGQHRGGILDLAASPVRDVVSSVGRDGTARLWRLSDGAQLACLPVYSWDFSTVAFLDGGSRVLVTNDRASSSIWTRRRPEYWWGIAWLPEFWLTAICAMAIAWSLGRDRQRVGRVRAQRDCGQKM